MKLRRAPFLKPGNETRQTVQSPRITSAPFYSRAELDVAVDPYTPGLLGRISRAGFNAIWVWGDIEDIAHSSVYPELDHGVAERQGASGISSLARLVTELTFTFNSETVPQTSEFFARHPEVKGGEMRWYGGFKRSLHERGGGERAFAISYPEPHDSCSGAKGFVYIVGGEGFLALLDSREYLSPMFNARRRM